MLRAGVLVKDSDELHLKFFRKLTEQEKLQTTDENNLTSHCQALKA